MEQRSTDAVIRVANLGKTYRVYHRPLDRALEWLGGRPRHQAFHALEGVSFELERGESLGIVGENGAGKSTLLKILSGVSQPTAGNVEVNGRVASILELGSGFHPEFSGRQNVRINAALLGLSEHRVEERLPEIIDFSELGEFIDRPVKSYSTGMAMRLAFSIATQVDPEILIVDEALSVGDGYFQKKCMDRMVRLVDQGTTLLFCTHAMYYLTSFCQKALWLKKGRVEAEGRALDVVAEYEAFLQARAAAGGLTRGADAAETGAREAPVQSVASLDRVQVAAPSAAEGWSIDVSFSAESIRTQLHLAVGLDRADGVQVLAMSSLEAGLEPWSGSTRHRVRVEVPSLPILQGRFTLYVFLLDEAGLHVYDRRVLVDALEIDPQAYRIGLLELPHRFVTLKTRNPEDS